MNVWFDDECNAMHKYIKFFLTMTLPPAHPYDGIIVISFNVINASNHMRHLFIWGITDMGICVITDLFIWLGNMGKE